MTALKHTGSSCEAGCQRGNTTAGDLPLGHIQCIHRVPGQLHTTERRPCERLVKELEELIGSSLPPPWNLMIHTGPAAPVAVVRCVTAGRTEPPPSLVEGSGILREETVYFMSYERGRTLRVAVGRRPHRCGRDSHCTAAWVMQALGGAFIRP